MNEDKKPEEKPSKNFFVVGNCAIMAEGLDVALIVEAMKRSEKK